MSFDKAVDLQDHVRHIAFGLTGSGAGASTVPLFVHRKSRYPKAAALS